MTLPKMMDYYLVQASSYAADIDNLILLVTVITGFWFILAQGLFFGFIIKFNRKEGVRALHISGNEWKEKKWVAIPHYLVLVFDVMIIVAAIRVWVDVKQTMPPPDETVRVIAQQWAWTFVHPGPDGKLDTPDDIKVIDELHVEVNKTYHFELQSKDVLHSFSVPVFRLKQDIVPGRTIRGWFKPILTGQWDIQCTEICGMGHGLMPARIFIESAPEHANWLKANSAVAAAVPAPGPAPAPPAPVPAAPPSGGNR